MYQLVNDFSGQPAQAIKRIADGASIPFDPANTDYQAYLAWVAEGNTPEPVPMPSPEEALAAEREAASLRRFDFASRAAQAGFITWAEAAAWAAGNAMPAAVETMLNALPEEARGPALLDVMALPVLRRNGDLMPHLLAAFDATDEQADALFGIVAP